jgi:hypothetical protein
MSPGGVAETISTFLARPSAVISNSAETVPHAYALMPFVRSTGLGGGIKFISAGLAKRVVAAAASSVARLAYASR